MFMCVHICTHVCSAYTYVCRSQRGVLGVLHDFSLPHFLEAGSFPKPQAHYFVSHYDTELLRLSEPPVSVALSVGAIVMLRTTLSFRAGPFMHKHQALLPVEPFPQPPNTYF